MAPCDFWLFPKLKATPKAGRSKSRGNCEKSDRRALHYSNFGIPEMLPAMEEVCVHSQGFEGD